ncbi:MAG: adenylate/guanylate cyclase domain-containing protein [Oleispira sp.]
MKKPTSSDHSFSLSNTRFPLFWQMLLAMTLVLCLSTGALWGYLQLNFSQLMQNQTDTFANTITQQAANSAAEMLMADDYMALSAMLENLVRTSDNILSISVQDDANKTVALALGAALENQVNIVSSSSDYQANILFHGVKAGTIQLSLDNSVISESLKKTLRALGIILIGIVLLAIGSSILIAKKLTQSLKQLQITTRQVAKGNLYPTLPKVRNNEVGDLVKSFEHMLQGLRDKESIEHKFSSFISKDIAKDILSDLKQHKKPLKSVTGSVLFVDIVGFTQLSENQSPQRIADILNQYYSLLHQVSKIYWGSVDNYIGDGAMLTFGVHTDNHKHSINAICAAQLFIRLSKALNQQRSDNDLPALDFRLGLHCGEMLAGAIGDNERMQFTISGDSVNIAARLCDLASPNKLLISESVYQHPACDSLLVTEPSESFAIKGKTHPINCFSVIGLAPKFNRMLMQQENELKAMQEYV